MLAGGESHCRTVQPARRPRAGRSLTTEAVAACRPSSRDCAPRNPHQTPSSGAATRPIRDASAEEAAEQHLLCIASAPTLTVWSWCSCCLVCWWPRGPPPWFALLATSQSHHAGPSAWAVWSSQSWQLSPLCCLDRDARWRDWSRRIARSARRCYRMPWNGTRMSATSSRPATASRLHSPPPSTARLASLAGRRRSHLPRRQWFRAGV